MSDNLWVVEECEKLRHLSSLAQFYQHLSRFAEQLEFRHTLYTVLPDYATASTKQAPYAFHTNYSQDWMSYYQDKRYDLNDQALIHCLSGSTKPYLHLMGSSLSRLPSKQQRVIHDARHAGIESLICIPVRNAFGSTGVFSFSFEGSRQQFQTFSRERMSQLLLYTHTMNEMVHANTLPEVIRYFGESQKPRITPREQAVLQYLASGATYEQIAGKTNVGISTVRKHVQSLLRKLNARNTAHACALAVRWGLVC